MTSERGFLLPASAAVKPETNLSSVSSRLESIFVVRMRTISAIYHAFILFHPIFHGSRSKAQHKLVGNRSFGSYTSFLQEHEVFFLCFEFLNLSYTLEKQGI